VKPELHKHLNSVTMHPVGNGIIRSNAHEVCQVQTTIPLRRSKGLKARKRGTFKWLRGLDLNQRPLGYESEDLIIFNKLDDTDSIEKHY
jgi:hypothetical protein